MNAVLISIGDELTSGQTVDTNSAIFRARLAARGIATLAHCTIGDDRRAIAEAIRGASTMAELVIVSGGLGPTEDDLTRHALADVMGVELRLDEKCLATLAEFFRRRGRTMVAANQIQAMVPAGADVLDNHVGTAAGLAAQGRQGAGVRRAGRAIRNAMDFRERDCPSPAARRGRDIAPRGPHVRRGRVGCRGKDRRPDAARE